jgi:hypothetical protein
MHSVGKLQSFLTFRLVYHVIGAVLYILNIRRKYSCCIVQIKVCVGSFEAAVQTRERDVFKHFV